MSNPRAEIDDLKLQGSPNLRRSLKRIEDEGEPPEITPDTRSEIEKLDALIAQAMKAAAHGSTRKGKRNPAFANLESLMRCRATLLKGQKKSGAKTAADVLAEANKFLGIGN